MGRRAVWVGVLGGVVLGILAGAMPPADPVAAQQAARVENRQQWYADGQAAVRNALRLSPASGRATHVILFVGDGMGISTVTAARILEGQMHGGAGEDNRLSFETMPYVALSKTYAVNQQVSDSGPTMTAMVTGVKTNGDVLSVDQDAVHGDYATSRGHELTTLLELAEDAGLSTGIVSTARLTHATPAATYAHTVDRNWEDDSTLPAPARSAGYPDIARQFLELRHGNGVEVALAGGRSQFLPNTMTDPEYPRLAGARLDGRNLADEWVQAHPRSRWVWNDAQFRQVDPRQTDHLLGLFEPSYMQYEHDRPKDGAGEPSLTEMTATALAILSRNPRGYFLMVEGGRIDHAHHAGNAYRALTETIELSNAVRLAMTRTNPSDTLIVVTADHSHGLTLSGYPTRGNPILGKVVGNNAAGRSTGRYEMNLFGTPYTTLQYANGPGFAGASAQQPEGSKRFPHDPSVARMARVPLDLTSRDTEDPDYLQDTLVPLASETHSGEDVAIYATGPAANLLHGVLEQNVIFHVMAYALRLAR